MSTRLKSRSLPSKETLFLQLSKTDSGVSTTLRRLLKSVPMPMDAACLSLVCKGDPGVGTVDIGDSLPPIGKLGACAGHGASHAGGQCPCAAVCAK